MVLCLSSCTLNLQYSKHKHMQLLICCMHQKGAHLQLLCVLLCQLGCPAALQLLLISAVLGQREADC